MCKIMFLFWLVLLIKNNDGFNVDTDYPLVYVDPLKDLSQNRNKSSYFGYSLVLHPGNNINQSWIFIGAPRGHNVNTDSTNSGVCFKCKIKESCNIFNFHEQPNALGYGMAENLNNSWIGGSMDINYKDNLVVYHQTCAFRWIKIKAKGPWDHLDDYHMQGSCYWYHVTDNTTEKFFPLINSKDKYKSLDGSVRYHSAQGEVGFSLHMPSKGREVLLGAPGVLDSTGTVILYRGGTEDHPVASKLRGRPKRYANAAEFGNEYVANPEETAQTTIYDFFGYSSTSGCFYNRTKLLYASGAPRSTMYRGQVLIYDFPESEYPALNVVESKQGVQFGEYFGASLTAGDINGDGFDDLIVGAPFFTTKTFNEGKIYIYMGGEKKLLQITNRDFIFGRVTNGQFGATVQYIEDINHDGFGDIAVAAPHEEGGVIYIYRGTSEGLETKECQRVVGKDISPNVKGFGMSISRPADVDGNKYLDLAIGAPISGHVVVLRSRPTVTVHHALESFHQRLEIQQRFFEISTCFWLKTDQQDASISVRRILSIDQSLGRAHLRSSSGNERIHLELGKRTCQNLTIELESSSNHYDPLSVSLSHEFINPDEDKEVILISQNASGTDNFCVTCPVYNKYGSDPALTINIPFTLGCKRDNVCETSLQFEPTLVGLGGSSTYVLGSKDHLTLSTTIKNLGEKAYSTQIAVVLPEFVNLQNIPSACGQQNASAILCTVANPLEPNEEKAIDLNLDMSAINSGKYEDSFGVVVTVLTTSQNNLNNVKSLIVKLKREADVTIIGNSDKQSYCYCNTTQAKLDFVQTYQIEKFGYSFLNEIVVEIDIPHIFRTEEGTEIGFMQLDSVARLGNQEMVCNSNSDYKRISRSTANRKVFSEFDVFENRTFYVNCSMSEIRCIKVSCAVGPILSGQIFNIQLQMRINISAIMNLLGRKDVVLLATQGRVVVTSPSNFIQTGNRPDSFAVGSLLIRKTSMEKVASWITVLSVITGLLLFFLLLFTLIKCGFFRRKRKEQLEKLIKEVEDNEDKSLSTETESQIELHDA